MRFVAITRCLKTNRFDQDNGATSFHFKGVFMGKSVKNIKVFSTGKIFSLGFDYILIDCPPSLSLLTINALNAADEVIIPVQCEFYALEGLSRLMETLELVKERLNPELKIRGIVLTMYDGRTIISQQVAEEAREHFKDLVFKTMIPRNVRIAEAPSFGLPIVMYDKASAGAAAYETLSQEVIQYA